MRSRRLVVLFVLAACGAQRPTHERSAPTPGFEQHGSGHGQGSSAAHGAHAHGGHAHRSSHDAGAHGEGYAKDFSAAEAFAAQFDAAERDAWQKPDEVVRLLQVQAGARVADLGAGTGYFLAHLSSAVGGTGHVVALDSEPNMVRYMEQRAKAKEWTNVEARQIAPDDPGLASESVDRVLIVNTWHHIADRERYAAKLLRALRAGGFVMIVDFTRQSDIGPPLPHRLSPEQVVRELSAGGLRAEVVAHSLPKQYVVVGTRP